jgi:hypothetical protein
MSRYVLVFILKRYGMMWCYRRGHDIAIWVSSGLNLQIERFVELVDVSRLAER